MSFAAQLVANSILFSLCCIGRVLHSSPQLLGNRPCRLRYRRAFAVTQLDSTPQATSRSQTLIQVQLHPYSYRSPLTVP